LLNGDAVIDDGDVVRLKKLEERNGGDE